MKLSPKFHEYLRAMEDFLENFANVILTESCLQSSLKKI